MIRLRVAGVAPGLCQARARSAPRGKQAFPVCRGERHLRACRQRLLLGLELAHHPETLVPAALELGRDEAVVGVHGVILAASMCHLVACLLKSEFDLTPSLALLDPACLQSADRGLDAERAADRVTRSRADLGTRRVGRGCCLTGGGSVLRVAKG